jgi:hypothetical protein
VVVMGSVNGFNAIEGGVRLRGVKKGVLMAGELRCRAASLCSKPGGVGWLEAVGRGAITIGIGRRRVG